jgi:integrase
MRGTLKQRSPGSWTLIIDLGYQVDPGAGTRKRKQKWITVRGTRQEAEKELTKLVGKQHDGQFVSPHKRTVGDWLDEWVEKAIKPPLRAPRTYEAYLGVIRDHLKPALGAIRLQQLRPLDVERFHAESKVSPATGQKHHAILSCALEAAVRADLVTRNVATLASNKPKQPEGHPDVLAHCWEAHEARAFLAAAKDAGAQAAAFYTLALETGMRKSELCGLKWSDLDAAGRLTVQRQLVTLGPEPTFGPVKNKTPRMLEVAPDTLALLKKHRQHQAEIKLANRTVYNDLGLMFAKEWHDALRRHDTLGDPLQTNNLGQREFARLIKASGVRVIKFHGMRHTCATLLLQAGVPAHVVQKRLGHKRIEMTLGIYGHVLPSMQQDAAARLSALLQG